MPISALFNVAHARIWLLAFSILPVGCPYSKNLAVGIWFDDKAGIGGAGFTFVGVTAVIFVDNVGQFLSGVGNCFSDHILNHKETMLAVDDFFTR